MRKATEKTNVEISLQDKIVIQELFAHSKMDKPQSSCPFVDAEWIARPVAVLSLAYTLANSFYDKKISKENKLRKATEKQNSCA